KSGIMPCCRKHLLLRHGELCERRFSDDIRGGAPRWNAALLPTVRERGIAHCGLGSHHSYRSACDALQVRIVDLLSLHQKHDEAHLMTLACPDRHLNRRT